MEPDDAQDRAAAGWRGMESAPMDGTRVLLAWVDGWIDIGRWIVVDRDARWGEETATPASQSGWSEDGETFSWTDSRPICWMPLPSGPMRLGPTSGSESEAL